MVYSIKTIFFNLAYASFTRFNINVGSDELPNEYDP
jgi:hypothetical protein